MTVAAIDSKKPIVSVIIPCYKQAHYLTHAIDSILAQTHSGAQIVVVNDGSPDNTPAVARRYGDRIIYIERLNGGLPAARNTGLQAATGDYVQFLDADDFLAPEMHAQALGSFAADPTAGAVYCGHFRTDEAGQVISRGPHEPSTDDPFHRLLRGNPWPCHTLIVRRSALPLNPQFDESLRSCEDWDLWLRLAATGVRFRPVGGAWVYYRTYPTSMSKRGLVMFETSLNVIRRHARRHGCSQCERSSREGIDYVFRAFAEPELEARLTRRQGLSWLAGCFLCARLDWTTFQKYRSGLRHRKRTIARALTPFRPQS